MRVIDLATEKKGRLEVLQVTDGAQVFSLTFKEEKELKEWKDILERTISKNIVNSIDQVLTTNVLLRVPSLTVNMIH